MLPTLAPNDTLIVQPCAGNGVAVGDVVLAHHPSEPRVIVKRVAAAEADGIRVASDNPAIGQDSRHFGVLPGTSIIGRVTAVV